MTSEQPSLSFRRAPSSCRSFLLGIPLVVALCLGSLGCAGLMEYQGHLMMSPTSEETPTGAGLEAHIGTSEDSEFPISGYGASMRVAVTEVHALAEQGAHGFLLTEIQPDWAVYGRVGGAFGFDFDRLKQVSVTGFAQAGTMVCLSEPSVQCPSAGIQMHYTSIFNDLYDARPWFGFYLGFGSFWKKN